MTTDRKNFIFTPRRGIMAEIEYPGVAQLVGRDIWEREARVRAEVLGKPEKPWDTWADSTFPLAGNWSKIGVDHMFDHNWKTSYPGVAQLVARLLWENTPSRINNSITGCSAVGSAPALGAGCRRFESCHSDHAECPYRI